MRFLRILAGFLLANAATAWEPEDHEIFRLRDDVIASEGPDATFYSFIGVTRKATNAELNQAYRKKAARMHPDKARRTFINNYGKTKDADGKVVKNANKKGPSKRELDAFYKDASERFARLSVINNVLKGPNRERYDFFLDHGFPKWRGTGYYYQRYRPGAGTVLIGLFIVMGGFAHYGALILGWKRQRTFAQKYITDARKLAWGNNMVVPGMDTAGPISVSANGGNANGSSAALNRRQKRLQDKETKKSLKKGVTADEISEPQEAHLISGPQGSKRRVVAENGKVLIVDSVGNVFLEETTEDGQSHEFLIDINEIQKPTMNDTVLVRLPLWLWNKTGGRLLSKQVEPPSLDESETIDGSDDHPALQSATATSVNNEARRRAKAKVRQRP